MAAQELVLLNSDEVNVEVAVERIGQAWHSTIDSLFTVILLIRECLGKKGFKELQTELDKRGIMKSSVFSMFKTIAQNPLIEPSVKDKLPPAYNTLYYISRIENQKVLGKLLTSGGINRDTNLEEAKQIYRDLSEETQAKDEFEKAKPAPTYIPVASVKIRREDFKKNKTKIIKLLDELEQLGLVIKRGDELQ